MASTYLRDSVILSNDLPYDITGLTASSDGRFFFVIGQQRLTSIGSETVIDDHFPNLEDDQCLTYDVDVIDLFLSKRYRISGIGDLYGHGYQCDGYALDDTHLVLVDNHPIQSLFRQWLVTIDLDKNTAECIGYRAYSTAFEWNFWTITFGETLAVAVSENNEMGYIFPVLPFSPTPKRDISTLIVKADNYARDNYDWQLHPEEAASIHYRPFFVNDYTLGFFVKQRDDVGGSYYYDLATVIILDLNTERVEMREVSFSSPSRPWIDSGLADDIQHHQANNGELIMTATSDGVEVFFGILRTKELKWTEIREKLGDRSNVGLSGHWDPDTVTLCPIRGGSQFFVHDEVLQQGESRVIGGRIREGAALNRLRLFASPLSVPSLARLASIAVQRSGRVDEQQLQQIAART